MRTEEEIRERIKEYTKAIERRGIIDPLDRFLNLYDMPYIEALEWVLESEANND